MAASTANAEGAVYAALMIGVLLAAEDPGRETYAETIGATMIVLAFYWLTHMYTHVLGVRLRTHEPLAPNVIRRSLVHELPVIEGGVIPMFVLVLAWVLGASVSTGVLAAILATGASIIVLEVAAAWTVRPRDTGLWARAALGTVSGLGLVAVKVVLHV